MVQKELQTQVPYVSIKESSGSNAQHSR